MRGWAFCLDIGVLMLLVCSSFVLLLLWCSLTVPIMNVLLSELLLLSRIPSGTEHGDLNVEELDEATAAAVYLYHRWQVVVYMFSNLLF